MVRKYILFIGFGLSLCFLFLAFTGLLTINNEKKAVLGAEDEISPTIEVTTTQENPTQEQMRFPAGDNKAAQQQVPTATNVPEPTELMYTCTPTPSNTPKPTKTPGPSPTKKPSSTPKPTSKYSPTPSKTPTPTRKPSKGPSPTPTKTPTRKPTKTPTPTTPVCWCTLTPAARATLTAAATHPSTVPTHEAQAITPTVAFTSTPSPVPSPIPTNTETPTPTPSSTLTPSPTATPTNTPSPTYTPTATPTLIARIELQQGLGEITTDENGDNSIPVAIRVINTGETPLDTVQLSTDLKKSGSFGNSLKGVIGHRAPFKSDAPVNRGFNGSSNTHHFAPPTELQPGDQILVVYTATVEQLTGTFTVPTEVTARSPSGFLSDEDIQTVPLVAPSPTTIPSPTPTPTTTPTETPSPIPTNTPTATPSPTRTPTPTSSNTPTPTATRTPTPSRTPTPGVLGAQNSISPTITPSPTPNSQPSSTDSGSIRTMQPVDVTGAPSTTPGSVLAENDTTKSNTTLSVTAAPTAGNSSTPTPSQTTADTLVNAGIPILFSVVVGILLILAVMTIRSVDALQHRNFTPLPDFLQDELDKLEK